MFFSLFLSLFWWVLTRDWNRNSPEILETAFMAFFLILSSGSSTFSTTFCDGVKKQKTVMTWSLWTLITSCKNENIMKLADEDKDNSWWKVDKSLQILTFIDAALKVAKENRRRVLVWRSYKQDDFVWKYMSSLTGALVEDI